MAQPAGTPRAGLRPRIGIDTEFESERVDIVPERFHAMGKSLCVNDNVALLVTADLPAIVDIHVDVSGILHARLDHGISHSFDHVFAHIALELVP